VNKKLTALRVVGRVIVLLSLFGVLVLLGVNLTTTLAIVGFAFNADNYLSKLLGGAGSPKKQ
jgi:hypothetical protein